MAGFEALTFDLKKFSRLPTRSPYIIIRPVGSDVYDQLRYTSQTPGFFVDDVKPTDDMHTLILCSLPRLYSVCS